MMFNATTNRRRTLLAAASLLLVSTAPVAAERLADDAIRESLSGRTLTGTTSSGKTWEATYSTDGAMNVRLVDADWRDSGTWEVKDGKLCSERSKRAYRCSEVIRTGAGHFEFVDDRRQTTKARYVR